jgi:hypothetical protein
MDRLSVAHRQVQSHVLHGNGSIIWCDHELETLLMPRPCRYDRSIAND